MKCPPRSRVEEEVLARIRPSRAQSRLLHALYQWLRKVLESCLSRRGLDFEIIPVGSYAKGTITSDKWELDVFVLFRGVDDSWINSRAEPLLRSCLARDFPVMVKYAQHPYVTVTILGMEADVVPAVKVDAPRRKGLGVERTPFHTMYVLSKLDDCMRDEVRLLKAFLKGIGVYGAETRVRGFSGYLTELLIIHYGSFRRLISEARRWRPPVYIDPEGVGDKRLLLEKYRESPLIVVDPVDPARNAAAAVSLKSLSTFILASKLYSRNPSKEFFHPYSKPVVRRPYGHLVRVECTGDYTGRSPEAVWGKAVRGARELYTILERSGFEPTIYRAETDEARWITVEVVVLKRTLPPVEVAKGPPAWAGDEGIMRFIERRLEEGYPVWVGDDGRIYGVRERSARRVDDLVYSWAIERAPGLLGSSNCAASIFECREGIEPCSSIPGWMTL